MIAASATDWTARAIALAGLTVAASSVAWSIYIGRRDRARLKASCVIWHSGNPDDPDEIAPQLHLVNAGRRPVTPYWLRLKYSGRAGWVGKSIMRKPLNEGDPLDISLELSYLYDDETGEDLIDVRIEDSLGKTTRVKNGQENLRVCREARDRRLKKTL